MIIYKQWKKSSSLGAKTYTYEGWFLFGLVPLYIRRTGAFY